MPENIKHYANPALPSGGTRRWSAASAGQCQGKAKTFQTRDEPLEHQLQTKRRLFDAAVRQKTCIREHENWLRTKGQISSKTSRSIKVHRKWNAKLSYNDHRWRTNGPSSHGIDMVHYTVGENIKRGNFCSFLTRTVQALVQCLQTAEWSVLTTSKL